MALIWIDVENGAGVRFGKGPVTSAGMWRSTARMDKAGTFEFVMPASDPQSDLIVRKRVVRASTLWNGARVEIGAGIIDRIERRPQSDGTWSLVVAGDDLVRELTYRSVLGLKLYGDGSATTHAAALAAVAAYAPAGWVLTPQAGSTASVYGYFNGESVLAACAKVAEKSLNHFYRGVGRQLIFAASFSASGVRAIEATGQLTPQTAAIKSMTRRTDTYDLITRIYPRGSGNANVQLTLRATTRTAPAGYTLNKTLNFLEHNASSTAYGLIERQIDFREIGPVDNTTPDVVAASNALFDAALETLQRRCIEIIQETYTLSLEGCTTILRPLQTIDLVYRDAMTGTALDQTLNILEVTTEVGAAGVFTSGLIVSNADRWPPSDTASVADGIEQGHLYRSLQQLNANSYTQTFQKLVDNIETASFRWRFGNEVTQLRQVLFEFQLLPFQSTVKSVAGSSTSSGQSATQTSSATTTTTTVDGGAIVTLPISTQSVNRTDGPSGINGDSSGSTTVASGVPHSHSIVHDHSIVHNHTLNVAAHGHGMGHTHPIPHDHTFVPVITAEYGIYRDAAGVTFLYTQLEYQVNGGGWLSLGAAVDAGDGWLSLDLTTALMESDTFRPLHENNLLEIRRRASVTGVAMSSWQSVGTANNITINMSSGITVTVGERVTIEGAPLGTAGGNINGTRVVTAVTSTVLYSVANPNLAAQTGGSGGTVHKERRATIDAQLAIVDIIQAVSLT